MALADGEHCGGFHKALSWQPCPALHHSFPAPTSSSRPSPETVVLSGALGVGFTDFFFFFCLCFVFCFFSFKASSKFEETALSIICRSFFHGEEQEGVPSAMRFHLLNPISGSRRSLPCQAQFTASSEAWGRGPSRSHSPDSKPSWRNECLVLRLVCSIHSTG